MNSGEKKSKKKIISIAFITIALILFAGCSVYIVNYYKTQREAQESYERLQKQQEEQRKQRLEMAIEAEESEESEEEVEKVEIPIDFQELQETNPDIYAWISIPGTKIDYPILQSPTDDTYYLNHTVDKVEGLPGSIYTEGLNSKDFSDPNTLIYGHNMRNGTMFAGLHSYADNQFFKENPYINIYTPEKALKYQIFAAYISDDRHILKSFDFQIPEVYENYLESIYSIRSMGASINKELNITSEDKIITLSTCNSIDNQRWLIQAVLIEGE